MITKHKLIEVKAEQIEQHYHVLNRIGNLDNGAGFSRPAYSDDETAVMDYFAAQATAYGLRVRHDAALNMIIETTGEYPRWFECASHVDTVPGGGNFDGLAGVVAGFAAICAVLEHYHRQGYRQTCGFRLRIWRGEESASFGVTSIGASAALGTLDIKRLPAGLCSAMQLQGVELSKLSLAQPLMDEKELQSIATHIELHIEQGKVLEQAEQDIGIVTGIRAASRYWVNIHGSFDHSGATPMGSQYRRDAHLALAYMLVHLDQLLHSEMFSGRDLVQTIGHINSHREHNAQHPEVLAQAISKIAGFASFSWEVRSCDDALRASYCQHALTELQQLAKTFSVDIDIELISEGRGVPALSATVQQKLIALCQRSDLRWQCLPSGAWHDAALVAAHQLSNGQKIPTGMLFIPCKEGKSHSADEWASAEQLANGANILAAYMQHMEDVDD